MLGLSSPVTKSDVTRAFRQLSMCTHPDRLVNLGPAQQACATCLRTHAYREPNTHRYVYPCGRYHGRHVPTHPYTQGSTCTRTRHAHTMHACSAGSCHSDLHAVLVGRGCGSWMCVMDVGRKYGSWTDVGHGCGSWMWVVDGCGSWMWVVDGCAACAPQLVLG